MGFSSTHPHSSNPNLFLSANISFILFILSPGLIRLIYCLYHVLHKFLLLMTCLPASCDIITYQSGHISSSSLFFRGMTTVSQLVKVSRVLTVTEIVMAGMEVYIPHSYDSSSESKPWFDDSQQSTKEMGPTSYSKKAPLKSPSYGSRTPKLISLSFITVRIIHVPRSSLAVYLLTKCGGECPESWVCSRALCFHYNPWD